MTRDEAIQLAAKLRGILPTMTPDQVVQAGKDMLRLEYLATAIRLDEYTATAQWFNRAEFLKAVTPVQIEQPKVSQFDRTAQALAEEKQRAEALAAEWASIDEIIAGMTDPELAEHAAAVSADSPDLAPILATKDPRRSKLLKGLIAERVRGLETVGAISAARGAAGR